MQKITQDLFYQFQSMSNLTYNPAKTKAVFTVTQADAKKNDYTQHLWCYDGDKLFQLTAASKEAQFTWLDDDTVLFIANRADSTTGVHTVFYQISVNGGEAVKAFELPLAVNSFKAYRAYYLVSATVDVNHPDYYLKSEAEQKKIDEEIKADEDYQIVDEYPFFFNGAGYINKTRTGLFLVDKQTQQITQITSATMDVESYDIDETETHILYSGIDYPSFKNKWSQVYEYDIVSKKTKVLYQKEDMQISRVFYYQDCVLVAGTFGEEIGAMQNSSFYTLKEETMELYLYNDTSLYNSIGSDVRFGHGKSFLKEAGVPYFVTSIESRAELWKMEQNQLTPLITIEGSVDDFAVGNNRMLVIGLFEQKLQELYEYANGQLKQLSQFNEPILRDRYVAIPQPCTVEKEPFAIHGWVLKPYGYDPEKRYPAILDIHGGPKGAYGEVYYHEMQYWASLGYFVFYCNPRGGDGRGNRFTDLRRNWGKIDYEDIMDFTDEVLKQYPAIDTSRVAVTGGSYGGYMTNWIIGHTDRFCAAATQRSISNLISHATASDYGIDLPVEMEFEDVYNCAEELWDMSPLKYANNVKTPTLFIHSLEDYRCPYPEGLQLYTAIKCRGVDARMCLFKGENHELSRGGKPLHRAKRLNEITAWLDRYTKRETKEETV